MAPRWRWPSLETPAHQRSPMISKNDSLRTRWFASARSEERRVGKECRSWRDWSSDVCSSDLYGAALALAIVVPSRAPALADDLEKRFPENTVVRFSYLPVIRARIALNRHDAARAIEI